MIIKLGSAHEARQLWKRVAPRDTWEYDDCWHWIAYDNKTPVGFASSRKVYSRENWGYIAACGVLASHRGHGLMRKLVARVAKHAREQGWDGVLTYVALNNIPSMISLLRSGFRFYLPEEHWVGDEFHYMLKRFRRAKQEVPNVPEPDEDDG